MGTAYPNIQTELLLFQCVPDVCHLPSVHLGKDVISIVLLTCSAGCAIPSPGMVDQAQIPQTLYTGHMLWPLSIQVASAESASDHGCLSCIRGPKTTYGIADMV